METPTRASILAGHDEHSSRSHRRNRSRIAALKRHIAWPQFRGTGHLQSVAPNIQKTAGKPQGKPEHIEREHHYGLLVTTDTTHMANSNNPDNGPESTPKKLRRDLPLIAVIGVSLATMAPSFGISTNPQGMVPAVGAAVPVAFALATVGVLLVAYSFMRLSQRFDHAGAVYVQVGATLGPRTGVLTGWLLVGAYAMFGVLASIASGRFVSGLVKEFGGSTPPDSFAYAVALIVLAGVTVLGLGTVKRSTTILIVVEATTVLLIAVVAIFILVHLMHGDGPQGQTLDMGVFQWSSANAPTQLLLGVTFGFLSFAGFEAATTLGDEAKSPRKDIPRALILVPIFAGIFFVLVSAVEVMGFGTSAAGVAAFCSRTAKTASCPSDLANSLAGKRHATASCSSLERWL